MKKVLFLSIMALVLCVATGAYACGTCGCAAAEEVVEEKAACPDCTEEVMCEACVAAAEVCPDCTEEVMCEACVAEKAAVEAPVAE